MALDPTKIPKGQSPEKTPNPRNRNQPGVYRHEASGKSLTATTVPAADAFVHQGFVRVGDVPKRQAAQKAAAKTGTDTTDLQKQLDAANKAQADAEKRAADAEAAQKAAEDAAAAAQAEAEAAKTAGNGGNQ